MTTVDIDLATTRAAHERMVEIGRGPRETAAIIAAAQDDGRIGRNDLFDAAKAGGRHDGPDAGKGQPLSRR